jgi:hypothetical protein
MHAVEQQRSGRPKCSFLKVGAVAVQVPVFWLPDSSQRAAKAERKRSFPHSAAEGVRNLACGSFEQV